VARNSACLFSSDAFGFPTLEAVILNKALSLVVVVAALLFRQRAIPFDETLAHAGTVLNLLAGVSSARGSRPGTPSDSPAQL
jgi:hypothetical protein